MSEIPGIIPIQIYPESYVIVGIEKINYDAVETSSKNLKWVEKVRRDRRRTLPVLSNKKSLRYSLLDFLVSIYFLRSRFLQTIYFLLLTK